MVVQVQLNCIGSWRAIQEENVYNVWCMQATWMQEKDVYMMADVDGKLDTYVDPAAT